MRPTGIGLAATLTLALIAPASAQENQRLGALDGIQSSVNERMRKAVEEQGPVYRESVRQLMLLGSDIRMAMVAEDDRVAERLGDTPLVWRQDAREASIYAEFDFQNQATSMRVRDSGGESALYFGADDGMDLLDSEDEAKDFTIYIDASGTAYVPIEHADDPAGEPRYVPVHLPTMMGGMAELLQQASDPAIESALADMLDALVQIEVEEVPLAEWEPLRRILEEEGITYREHWDGRWLPTPTEGCPPRRSLSDSCIDGMFYYQDEQGRRAVLTADAGEALLERFAQEFEAELEALSYLPPLIHFAYIITPEAVRSQLGVPVREQDATCSGGGIPGEEVFFPEEIDCTRFTVTGGDQEGYVLDFDGYGRLIHLRHPNGSTAWYSYDKDLTVP